MPLRSREARGPPLQISRFRDFVTHSSGLETPFFWGVATLSLGPTTENRLRRRASRILVVWDGCSGV